MVLQYAVGGFYVLIGKGIREDGFAIYTTSLLKCNTPSV